MRRTLLTGLAAGALMALSVGVVQSAPPAGATLSVRALRARLMARPQFIGSSVAKLHRGARLKMVRAKGAWYRVTYRGRDGWIHKNRVTKKVIKLRSGDTGTGTTSGEAELAGRGFSPKTEKRFKEKNPKLDFTHVDTIQEYDVAPSSTASFYQQGGLAKGARQGGDQ